MGKSKVFKPPKVDFRGQIVRAGGVPAKRTEPRIYFANMTNEETLHLDSSSDTDDDDDPLVPPKTSSPPTDSSSDLTHPHSHLLHTDLERSASLTDRVKRRVTPIWTRRVPRRKSRNTTYAPLPNRREGTTEEGNSLKPWHVQVHIFVVVMPILVLFEYIFETRRGFFSPVVARYSERFKYTTSLISEQLRTEPYLVYQTCWGMFILGCCYAVVRLRRLTYQRHLREALRVRPSFTFMKSVVGILPEFVDMRSKMDRTAWLNAIICDLWPSLGGLVFNILTEDVNPKLDRMKPDAVSELRIKRFFLGNKAISIDSATIFQFPNSRVDGTAPDHLALDASMKLNSEAEMQVVVGYRKLRTIAAIKNIKLNAQVRILFKPLVGTIPGFGGLAISFLGEPYLRFSSETKGLPLPGFLLNKITSLIIDIVIRRYIWPNRITVPISALGYRKCDLEPRPVAVIKVRLLAVTEGSDVLRKSKKHFRVTLGTRSGPKPRSQKLRFGKNGSLEFGDQTDLLTSLTKKALHRTRKALKFSKLEDRKIPQLAAADAVDYDAEQKYGQLFVLILKEPEVETVDFKLEMLERRLCGVSATTMARCSVKVSDIITDSPFEEDDVEVNYVAPMDWDEELRTGSRGPGLPASVRVGFILNRQDQGLDSAVGALWIKILDVVGVPRMDASGWSDPFFTVVVPDGRGGNRKFKTHIATCKDDRVVLNFDSEFTTMGIYIRESQDGPFLVDKVGAPLAITFQLYDSDAFSADDLIGETKYELQDLCSVTQAGTTGKAFDMVGYCPTKFIIPVEQRSSKAKNKSYEFTPTYKPFNSKMSTCNIKFNAIISWLGYD